MPVKKILEKEAAVSVSKTVLGTTKTKQEKINIRPFVTDTAQVGVKLGRTINMGNFENIKIEIFISAPCYLEEVVDVYNQTKEMASTLLGDEIESIIKGSKAE